MKYSIIDFHKEFPDEDACLDYLMKKKYPNERWHKLSGRKEYVNKEGKHVHPLAGTIFRDSHTDLRKWFYAIYLFSTHKNGVSAKTLERELKVTYKCAWRMAHKVRSLMAPSTEKLKGVVEADETWVGGKTQMKKGQLNNKTAVIGLVERGGGVRAKVSRRETHLVLNHLKDNVEKGTRVMSDQFGVYKKAVKFGYPHAAVNHGKDEYVRGEVHTNTIEGFWSQLKTSLRGTHHYVSKKHLQSYVDEFSFRYSYRHEPMFERIISRL